MRPSRVTRRTGFLLGAARLAVAAVIIGAVAYVLSWQILYSGPVGNDTLFQLHLVQWADSSFPGLHWWYPWDDHGIAYREGYPLAAHWVTAVIAHAAGVGLSQSMQLVQFAISPLDALGVYVFCAWRLKRPLAGVVAAIAYLLSPLSWTFIVDWGFYSNQAGTVFFMPGLIAVDIFFEEWKAGRRSARFRLAALAAMASLALMGLVAPFLLGAAVASVFAYLFAITGGGLRSRMRWLVVTAPLLVAGAFLLTAFWSLPQQAYLSFIGTHVPPRAFDPALFPVWGLDQLFALHLIRPDQIADRAAVSPAVWLPALFGALAAIWNPRARALAALVAFGVLTMTTTVLESLTWGLPVLGYLVHARAGVTLVQFLVPVLAGLGVAEFPAAMVAWGSTLVRMRGRARTFAAAGMVALALLLEASAVGQFAHWVAGSPNALAYGDFQPSTDDLWGHYRPGAAPPSDVAAQLANPAAWRAPRVGCLTGTCTIAAAQSTYRSLFATPPQRALVDAHVPLLLMDFPGLTGGAQAYTYNFQLPASPELDNWMLDSMLNRRGTVVKSELAAVAGVDSVVLGPTQAAQAADYEALGWTRVGESPLTFINPSPSGLAAEWASGAGVLVVGSDQVAGSHPYNDLFERATAGIIPYSSAWLIRGSSPYVDDYSASELAGFQALMLVGYRYHDRAKAWALLDAYVRGGGSLYVETGWQYVDPDWDLGSPAPSLLPVGELRWGALDPTAPVLIDGVATQSWGSMAYGNGGWGASSAGVGSLRAGAESVVSVGGRVVAARWQVGRGRVVWSGMNLIAHDAGAQSTFEDRFVAGQLQWLVGDRSAQAAPSVAWASDDVARVALSPAPGSVWVMLKESFAPGWSAELRLAKLARRCRRAQERTCARRRARFRGRAAGVRAARSCAHL